VNFTSTFFTWHLTDEIDINSILPVCAEMAHLHSQLFNTWDAMEKLRELHNFQVVSFEPDVPVW
jgi:hypothetical protein